MVMIQNKEGTQMPTTLKSSLKVADEVWVAAALLHREHPDKPDFAVEEIVERAAREAIAGPIRPGVYVHVVQHCVANRAPNPGRYRMLFETGPGRRRLFRIGDTYHPAREGGKITPVPEQMPPGYSELLDWYRDWSSEAQRAAKATDPLLALKGSGAHLWADEAPDKYVRRLREGWE
jgi:hypothetical protein